MTPAPPIPPSEKVHALVVEALRDALDIGGDECVDDWSGRRAEALLASPAWLAAMAAERDEAYQRGYVDGEKHAAPPIYQTGSAGEAVCERCEGVGIVPVNGQNRFCPDCNPEGKGPKVKPTLYMLVGKDGHREARVFYSYNKDTLTDFDAMRPANAPHRFVPLYERPGWVMVPTKEMWEALNNELPVEWNDAFRTRIAAGIRAMLAAAPEYKDAREQGREGKAYDL